jgi:phenylalanyl-tRNA synthetase beta chain
MKISISWLAKYLEIKENTKELEELLTFSGIEVEAVQNIPALPETVFSAKVISAEPVPKTDHLKLCLVDIGNYPYPEKTPEDYLQVICEHQLENRMMANRLPGFLYNITIKKA